MAQKPPYFRCADQQYKNKAPDMVTKDAQYRHIHYSVASGVATITLNRPEKLNVLGFGAGSNRDEIAAAAAVAAQDPNVGAILFAANGKAFCAGGDLSGVAPTETIFDEFEFNQGLVAFYDRLKAARKPMIAAVQGLCLGSGLGFIAQSDFVIAADNARFGLIEGRIGHPGATELVPIIGATWAKFMILTGELLDAEQAQRIGLVLSVEPHDQLLDRATELARRIASLPRESTTLNKACIDRINDVMGREAGRMIGRSYDTATKSAAKFAKAPDGRCFEDIFAKEGTTGLKAARDSQFTGSWLKPDKP
jgi:enoyl-CoA hydratase/carnithine racemase